MAICKHKNSFILEKRKDSADQILTDNIPILMSVTWKGKRLWYYTGYRIDADKWTDKTNEGEKVQRVRKNTLNKENISASIINARLTELENTVNNIFLELGKEIPTIEGLRDKIRAKLKENTNEPKESDLFDYFNQYIKEAKVSPGRKKQLSSTLNHFKNFSDSRKQKVTFERCDSNLLTEFEAYLKKSNSEKDKPRSRNTITGIMSRLRTFFFYAVSQKWTKTTPFEEYSIDPEIYGDPIYLTKDERDRLFNAKIDNERLARVRDMFVLQCFIGCRVGDFVKLRKTNIVKGFIHYVPSKTQDENQKVCKIPLSEKALSIINKYDLPDGALVPYITGQRYNEYLKELFALESVSLNRPVVRLNPLTLKNETVPLSQIACSHMARRTFIGLLHKTVKNEVIASMSGHVENSKAFHRYYNVDEESQKDAIKTIE